MIGIFLFLFSKYILFTHGLYKGIKSKRQKTINIWHGMPVKKIGGYEGKEVPEFDYVLCTSKFWIPIISTAFYCNQNKVKNLGLPRNDLLSSKITDNLSLKDLKNKFEKIFVWLPTYRKSTFGQIRTDGDPSSSPFGLNLDLEKINRNLALNKTLLILKPHPMSEHNSVIWDNYSNIAIKNNESFVDENFTLYELLAVSDLLITDVSSVFIDYLICQKPIIFCFSDLNKYRENRGFTIDIFNDGLPGPLVKNQDELIFQLNQTWKKIDNFEHKRKSNLLKYHNSCNKNSSYKIMEFLESIQNEK
jgi:CDP-glycerol glycerophosphotransferase (TagB/SpsB family)